MNLAVFQPTPLPPAPRIPLALDRPFRCETFNCVQLGVRCLQRQKLERVNRGGQKSRRTYHGFCASGRCEQGKKIAQAFPGAQVDAVALSDWSAYGLRAARAPFGDTKVCALATCAKTIKRRPHRSAAEWKKQKFCSLNCSRRDGAARRAALKRASA